MRLELIYIDEYIKRYYELLPLHPTYEKAWEALEAEYKYAIGRNRYANYATFRVVLCRWMKINRRC